MQDQGHAKQEEQAQIVKDSFQGAPGPLLTANEYQLSTDNLPNLTYPQELFGVCEDGEASHPPVFLARRPLYQDKWQDEGYFSRGVSGVTFGGSEPLDSAIWVEEMATLKSQHEAQMLEFTVEEQGLHEELQRSRTEDIQAFFGQPPKDEEYWSREPTLEEPPEALPSKPQTPAAAQAVFSEAGRAVREAECAVQQRQRITITFLAIWLAIFAAITALTQWIAAFLSVSPLDRAFFIGSSLTLAGLLVLFSSLSFSLVRARGGIYDILLCGKMPSPPGHALDTITTWSLGGASNAVISPREIRQVAQDLLHFVSFPLSWACNAMASQHSNTSWKMWVDCLNRLSRLRGSRRGDGMATVAWTCKCGKRLRLDVPEEHRQGAIAFAIQASGPSQQCSIEVTPPSTPSSPETDTQSLASSASLRTTTTSPSSAPSVSSGGDGGSLDHRPVPKGTPRFLLLCVKRGPGRIVPSTLNLTDVIHDTTMFQRIRDEYYGSRPIASGGWCAAIGYGWGLLRKWFLVPRTVEYVKFQPIRLQKSGTRVGSYETGQIPSVKQVYNMEYSYRPCPLDIGPYPIDPAIFMHWFLDPGDHADDQSMAVERLPKKLHSSLEDDMQSTPGGSPIGWGIYILEGLNWARIQVLTLVLFLVTFLFSVIWSRTREDIQGGMGIGQYLIALIVAVLPVSLLRFTPLEDLARGPAYRQ
ncbi:hypothetical protein RB595_004419 [Gaeumannomyces hyphopodioides]